MPAVNAQTQGRRGYYLYIYGTHLWFPQTYGDFSGGMFRDVAREEIPANGCYDALDLMLHRPGVAFKRGGSAYAGPAMTGATYAQGVAYVQFPGFSTTLVTINAGDGSLTFASSTQPFVPSLLGIGDNGHLYLIAAAGTQDLGTMALMTNMVDHPKFFATGTLSLVVMTNGDSNTTPYVYAGTKSGPEQLWDHETATQNLSISGTPTGGTFKIQIGGTGLNGTVTTGTIAFNASSTDVTTALNAVSSGYGCSGGSLPGTPIAITRPQVARGSFGYPVSTGYLPLTVTNQAFTGGSSPFALLTPGLRTSTAPSGAHAEVHLSRLVLARARGGQNRLWFGPLTTVLGIGGDWDSTAWIDFPDAITGLASVNGKLIVFSLKGYDALVGDVPPGVNATSNMTRTTISNIGCSDARSILIHQGNCYYANPQGVFVTQGLSPSPLMEGTISSYWRGLFTGYDPSTWTISTGLYAQRFLLVTVLDNTRALVTGLICDLAKGSWVRLSRPVAMMYATAAGVSDELYSAGAATNRVEALSGFFSPVAANKNDADGTAVTCLLETRPFGGGPGLGAFGKGHLTYDMRDAASDNPTLAVAIAPGIDAETYSAVAESPLAETTIKTRSRYSTGKRSQAVSVRFTQSNASSKTEIQMVEQDTRGFPREAGGQ